MAQKHPLYPLYCALLLAALLTGCGQMGPLQPAPPPERAGAFAQTQSG